jgi:cellobiose PTS system EIIA component
MENLAHSETAMMMILHAGDATNLAMQALRLIRQRKYKESLEMIESARKKSNEAHLIQTSLLTKLMTGENIEMNLLLVHAQDHLMNSLMTIDLAEELIEIFKELNPEVES